MAKYVLDNSDVEEIIGTIVELKRNSLPSGTCPYAAFGDGHKCIAKGCDVHQEQFWANYEKGWKEFFNEHKDSKGSKRIYVMNADMFEEKYIQDMTDAEIKELCEKDECCEEHNVYDSIEELSAYWNSDEIDSCNTYMRIIED